MRIVFLALLTIDWSWRLSRATYGQRQQVDERVRLTGFVKGHFTIGALFSIHERAKWVEGHSIRCGAIRDQYGMQRVEAALWTIHQINRSKKILKNYDLGIEIRDTCWNSRLALRQSLHFLDFCHSKSDTLQPRNAAPSSMVGVIGPPSSDETVQVQNLLQIFGVPQVGFSATSSKLSDKEKFGHFVRVVPSDKYQARAIVGILRTFNWTFVNAVSTDGTYGSSGMYEFRKQAYKSGICIQKEQVVGESAEARKYDKIFSMLPQVDRAAVIVCFCEGETVRNLLQAAKRANKSRRYVFIGSDGWGGRDDVVKNIEMEAEGNIMVVVNSPVVPNFSDYYFKMSERVTNSENPWIEEFYNHRFNCSLVQSPGIQPCAGREKLQVDFVEDPKLSYIIKSIYVFAYALRNFADKVCSKNVSAPCPALLNAAGSSFLEYVKNVTILYDNETLKFNENGDPPASYEVLNYQKLNGVYEYKKVGSWVNGTFNLDTGAVQLPGGVDRIRSVCSEPCRPGQYKVGAGYPPGTRNCLPHTVGGWITPSTRPYLRPYFHQEIESVKCCWMCVDCPSNATSSGEDNRCTACQFGSMPSQDRRSCVEMDVEPVRWLRIEIMVCVCISVVGISLALFSAAIFCKYSHTPMVRFSSKELSHVMFAGMIFACGSTFVILSPPTHLTCTLLRYIPGLSLTMIYGPLLVKTNRISRIFSMSKKRFPKLRPKYLSIKFQMLACSLFVVSELTACAVHTAIYPARVAREARLNKIVLRCECSPYELTIPYSLNIVLIALCTLYAFKTRNLPDNFNEAKFIAFSCYASAIAWSAFLFTYFGSSLQTISLSSVLATSALINLVCLFVPKLYIILLRPQKNQRANFATSKGIRCHFGSIDSMHNKDYSVRKINGFDSGTTTTDSKNSNRSVQGNSQR